MGTWEAEARTPGPVYTPGARDPRLPASLPPLPSSLRLCFPCPPHPPQGCLCLWSLEGGGFAGSALGIERPLFALGRAPGRPEPLLAVRYVRGRISSLSFFCTFHSCFLHQRHSPHTYSVKKEKQRVFKKQGVLRSRGDPLFE